VETIQPQIDGSGHKLTVMQPPARLMVDGDPARLAQAFMNILSNSAKYTDPGGQIELRVVNDGGFAAISVRDNGIGIPSHRLDRVFEMFSQEEAALSRARGGLGIGLSLTRRLVHMHGGTVAAMSEGAGKGSQFVVRLPLATAQPCTPDEEAPEELGGAQPAGLRILVADDNKDAAETLGLLLEVMGHEVRRVNDGEAAVHEAAQFDPHIVLLDIGMPKLNGYDACRQIRAQAGGSSRMVVAVTGWGQPQDVQSAQHAGFDQHMVKPIDPAVLARLIRSRVAASGG
jgi:CheY-like chemotaxis protein